MSPENIIILNELNRLLKIRLRNNLKDLILFGSRVHGTETGDSDYDILIILRKKADWKTEREISDICYEVDLRFNIITDTHVLSEDDLHTLRGKQPVYANALTFGIHA